MKTIAFDIDDVIAANAEGFVEFSNRRWGTNLKPGDYSEHWAQMWGISDDETEARREVILQNRVFLKHRFFDEAKPVLIKLKSHYKLVIISSRGPRVQAETIAWINQAYPGVFQEFHFPKIWDQPLTIDEKVKMTKAEICREVGADYLVDDQPKHCLAVADAGITALLFGDYDWNRKVKLQPNMVRAKTWQDVLEYFDARAGR